MYKTITLAFETEEAYLTFERGYMANCSMWPQNPLPLDRKMTENELLTDGEPVMDGDLELGYLCGGFPIVTIGNVFMPNVKMGGKSDRTGTCITYASWEALQQDGWRVA